MFTMINSELFWEANLDSIKNGYITNGEHFICLVCAKNVEKGIIFQDNGVFYEAEKYIKIHIKNEHDSIFKVLLDMDKKYTGLTELQKKLLTCFYDGISDQEIVKNSGGSASTIRTHRFTLREREKQAKVFLAIMEILKEKNEKRDKFIEIHPTATMVDERYAITEEENAKILLKYFKNGPNGKLLEFPTKEKRKIAILMNIIKKFEVGKNYSEKEVNAILSNIYEDYVTLRRYLIEYGFMDRKVDCSSYWVK